MISTREYKGIIEATLDVMPKLYQVLGEYDEKEVFSKLDEIRKVFKKVFTEFSTYQFYPRHDLTKYYELVNEVIDIAQSGDVVIYTTWYVETEVVMDEHNWSKYNSDDTIARFYLSGVEITRLIKFDL
jgi:hypothetical protein